MNIKNIGQKIKVLFIIGILVVLLPILPSCASGGMDMDGMSMDEKRDTFIALKENIQNEQLPKGDYACCLEKPCTYCIEKDPKHGVGATCTCLEDIMNGVHPCGECIGEIMEGHGNKFISKYFATAIAEEMGMEHLDALKLMMSQKYNITIEEQI